MTGRGNGHRPRFLRHRLTIIRDTGSIPRKERYYQLAIINANSAPFTEGEPNFCLNKLSLGVWPNPNIHATRSHLRRRLLIIVKDSIEVTGAMQNTDNLNTIR